MATCKIEAVDQDALAAGVDDVAALESAQSVAVLVSEAQSTEDGLLERRATICWLRRVEQAQYTVQILGT